MEEYNTTLSFTPTKAKNVSRKRSPPPTRPTVCGVCDTICIYSAVELIFIIGILANVLVFIRVIRDKKLRKPTFVALAQLALFEGLFLLFHTALNVELILYRTTCHVRTVAWSYVRGTLAMFWFCAAFHVTLLAAMRYIILTHPMKSLTLLTNKRIIIASVCLSIVSVLIFGTIMLVMRLKGHTPETENYISVITWFLTYFIPIVLTSVLHFVKLLFVRRSSKFQKDASGSHLKHRKSSARMVKIITIVIIAGALLPLPRFTLKILQDVCDIRIRNSTLRSHLLGASGLLFLLNFSINPFIYSFRSEVFRESLRRMTGSKISATNKKKQLHEVPSRTTQSGSPVIRTKSASQTNVTSLDDEIDTTNHVNPLELNDDMIYTTYHSTHL